MPHSRIHPSIRKWAKEHRSDPTWGEREMWKYLQSLRPFGARFRRQTPIGPYIADFAWLAARLVVEVDGASHTLKGQALRDRERDQFLRSQGFRVLRFWDQDVIANSADAFAVIEEAVGPRLRGAFLPVAQPGMGGPSPTPPHKGEGGALRPCARAGAVPQRPEHSPPPCGQGYGAGQMPGTAIAVENLAPPHLTSPLSQTAELGAGDPSPTPPHKGEGGADAGSGS
jgi:very-short-patch-repair endonuclease